MPLEVTHDANHQAENYSKIITKFAEYQQKAEAQQFVMTSDTERAIEQLFENYDLLGILDFSRLTEIANQKTTSGIASLQHMILFEIVKFNQINADTEVEYASLTFVIQKDDVNYISSHLAKLLDHQPVMILKREIASIGYDVYEIDSTFSIEMFTNRFTNRLQKSRDHLYQDSMANLLTIMSNKNVLNELKASNINMLEADTLPLFRQKLQRIDTKVTINSFLPFIQKLSLAELL